MRRIRTVNDLLSKDAKRIVLKHRIDIEQVFDQAERTANQLMPLTGQALKDYVLNTDESDLIRSYGSLAVLWYEMAQGDTTIWPGSHDATHTQVPTMPSREYLQAAYNIEESIYNSKTLKAANLEELMAWDAFGSMALTGKRRKSDYN